MNTAAETCIPGSLSTQGYNDEQSGRSRQAIVRLLIVEDDPDISNLLVYTLERAHFHATAVGDCKTAWKVMADNAFDLILLDWMLPDMSGIELLRRMRQNAAFSEIPVFMLTARCAEADRVCGLECGADDYIVKPFSPRELCARINSRLRIVSDRLSSTLQVSGLSLDQKSYRTSINGSTVVLSATEFRLLRHFMNNRERLLTRGQLLDSVWGANVYVEERTVDVHIRRLRKALEPFGKDDLIQTVRGAGYRFSDHG